MTETTDKPAATVTVLEQLVELRVVGQPDVKNKYGSGHIRPTEATFRYRSGGVRAQVYGLWVRPGGELTDARCSQDYSAHNGDMADWPEWLADLSREHQPAAPVVPPPATRVDVLREAADRLEVLRDSLITDPEITGKYLSGLERARSELRRMAAEEQPVSRPDAIARVRALHTPTDDGECRACHASFDPCPTIAALDEPAAEEQPVLCAECGHPRSMHRDGDDPVTPGTCLQCEAEGAEDDAHHDYEATAEEPQS